MPAGTRAIALSLVAFGWLTSPTVWAQVAVQQPVIGTTTVNTTVTVPDRGSAFLGGVNSARSGRVSAGFGPGRSAIGTETNASSMRASVYIHDLQAMDEALLAQGKSASEPMSAISSRLAERRGQGVASVPAEKPSINPAEHAARFEKLAREAEARGKTNTARLHWQMAAKYGSKAAAERLTPGRP